MQYLIKVGPDERYCIICSTITLNKRVGTAYSAVVNCIKCSGKMNFWKIILSKKEKYALIDNAS